MQNIFKNIIYYCAGVIKVDKKRILQVSNDIDGLSCELLASPPLVWFQTNSVKNMVKVSKELAKQYNCSRLEINCDKGLGSYQLLRIS